MRKNKISFFLKTMIVLLIVVCAVLCVSCRQKVDVPVHTTVDTASTDAATESVQKEDGETEETVPELTEANLIPDKVEETVSAEAEKPTATPGKPETNVTERPETNATEPPKETEAPETNVTEPPKETEAPETTPSTPPQETEVVPLPTGGSETPELGGSFDE